MKISKNLEDQNVEIDEKRLVIYNAGLEVDSDFNYGVKPEEEKVIEAVIEQAKKLVKKFGYKYTVAGCNRYFNNIKSQQKLLADIKRKESELNRKLVK